MAFKKLFLSLGLWLINIYALLQVSFSLRFRTEVKTLQPYVQEDYSKEILNLESYRVSEDWIDENNVQHFVLEYKGQKSYFIHSKIIKYLHLFLYKPSGDTIRFRIIDANNTRWEIPEEFPFPIFPKTTSDQDQQFCCQITISKDPFSFSVVKNDTGEVLFETKDKKLIYTDYYIELSTQLPSDKVYGFGERNYKFKLDPGVYTIWARDKADFIETGQGNGNTYGQHPVGLFQAKNGTFYTVLMKNSNAMDILIHNSTLTYKMVGGVIDLIIFVGDKYPDTSLKKYHEYIGKFHILPFWAMGFHQSRWGYKNLSMLAQVAQGFQTYEIPLDCIWSDIDYMDQEEDFTIDVQNFPLDGMKKLFADYRLRWVPIIDAGIKATEAKSSALESGKQFNVFIKNRNGKDLFGKVWPGPVHFPDFFNPNASIYWNKMLDELYEKMAFSGIWLDMNEISNFVDGEIDDHDPDPFPLVYTPGGEPLKTKTISLDAQMFGNRTNFNTHNLFALLESQATFNYLKQKSKQPFILSRSSFLGSGQFVANWNGDITSNWTLLQYSIATIFNFQIFGGPFVGADICGFIRDTNAELCGRWFQLGALYPFSRNHHHNEGQSQEPWAFQPIDPKNLVLSTSKAALKGRYSLLKWYYSIFIESKGTGSIFKPVFFEFPDEEELYEDSLSHQFLLGKGLMAAPVVTPGSLELEVYFPKCTWYSLFSGKKIIDQNEENRMKMIEAPFAALPPLFLREGQIVFIQDVQNVQRTQDLNNEFQVVFAFTEMNGTQGKEISSKGFLIGISNYDEQIVFENCIEGNCLYNFYAFFSSEPDQNIIDFEISKANQEAKLDKIGIISFKIYASEIAFQNKNVLHTQALNLNVLLYQLPVLTDPVSRIVAENAEVNNEGVILINLKEPIFVSDDNKVRIVINNNQNIEG